jgi:hypothetical protein
MAYKIIHNSKELLDGEMYKDDIKPTGLVGIARESYSGALWPGHQPY